MAEGAVEQHEDAVGCDMPKEAVELYKAVIGGNKEKVLELCQKEELQDTNSLTTLEETVLHIATYSQNKELIVELLEFYSGNTDILTKGNALGDTILHEAAATDMVDVADEMLKAASNLLNKRNDFGETPLFVAAHFGHTAMFKFLARKVEDDCITVTEDKESYLVGCGIRYDGTTILHIAILAEFYEMALDIVKRYPTLMDYHDEDGMTGLQLLSTNASAFRSGSNYGLLKRIIYYCVPSSDTDVPHGSHGMEDSSHGSELNNQSNRSRCPKLQPTYRTCKALYTIVASVLGRINRTIWDCFRWPLMREIWNEKKMHQSALRLARFLIQHDTSWEESSPEGQWGSGKTDIVKPKQTGYGNTFRRKDTSSKKSGQEEATSSQESNSSSDMGSSSNQDGTSDIEPETPLLMATRSGAVEIVKEILEVYPQAVEHVSKSGQNILHVAVKHRRKEIFKLVKKMKISMERLARRIDNNGFTVLHQVGSMDNYTGGKSLVPALQLRDELLWFERVKDCVLPHYPMHYNRDWQTALKLFENTHSDLLNNAQTWLKRTSESCSVVAGLIATVAFAAAYTIPGGPNQKTGIPILLNHPFFVVFTVMDVLSLATSLTSVVMFLSILTSPFQLLDFKHSLPRRLTLGFTFLFFSVALMMLAFSATIILTIHVNGRWTNLLIYAVAFLPVTIHALLQFPLYTALMTTTRQTIKMIMKLLPTFNPLLPNST